MPPAAVEHPVGTSSNATTPVAAATALRVFLVCFDFIVAAFHERGPIALCGQRHGLYPQLNTCKPISLPFVMFFTIASKTSVLSHPYWHNALVVCRTGTGTRDQQLRCEADDLNR